MKVRQAQLVVIDAIDIPEGKTKAVVEMLRALGIDSALIVIEAPNPLLERAARNLPNVKVLRAVGANVEDILRYRHLVLTQAAVTAVSGRVSP
jgi:large subunit ribosomal protein L4